MKILRKINWQIASFLVFLAGVYIYRVYPYLSGGIIGASDTGKLFHFFVYNLKSLQDFSEFAWWFPYPENGYPGYYYTVAGVIHLYHPLKLLYMAGIKLLSILNIVINPYAAFIWYQYLFAPVMLAIPVYLTARLLFKNKLPALLAILLFSVGYYPTVNLWEYYCTEPNLLPFWIIYFIVRYSKFPTKTNALLILFLVSLLPMTFNYAFLFSAIFYLPAFFIFLLFDKNLVKNLAHDLLSNPVRKYSYIALVCFIVGMIAAYVPLKIGFEYITRHGEHGNIFDIKTIGSLDPKNLLTIFTPFLFSIAGSYLGIITLTAFILAVFYAREKLFFVFLATFIFTAVFIPLGNKNPFYVFLFNHISILRVNEHIAYFTGRAGGLLFLIFIAGFGIDALINRLKKTRISGIFFMLILSACLLVSLSVVLFLSPETIKKEAAVTMLLFQYTAFGIMFEIYRKNIGNRKIGVILAAILLLVVFFDLHTVVGKYYSYIRNSPNHNNTEAQVIKDIYRNPTLTFSDYNVLGRYEGISHLSTFRPQFISSRFYLEAYEKYGADLLNIDRLIVTDNYKISQHYFEYSNEYETMLIDPKLPEFKKGLQANVSNGLFEINRFSFNKLAITVNNPQEQALIYRDTFDPFWQAFIDNKPTKIYPVNLGAYKGLILPQGRHIVHFIFNPWPAKYSFYALVVSFLLNTIAAIAILRKLKNS